MNRDHAIIFPSSFFPLSDLISANWEGGAFHIVTERFEEGKTFVCQSKKVLNSNIFVFLTLLLICLLVGL